MIKLPKIVGAEHGIPDFDAPFWSENGGSCPHERHKIGDSVLCVGDCINMMITLPKSVGDSSKNGGELPTTAPNQVLEG